MEPENGLESARIEMVFEGLEYLAQGFSIFDHNFRLAAWNRRFLELLEFPEEFGSLDRPLSDFFRFNAARGDYGPGDVEKHIEERMALAEKAEAHCFERVRPNGTVIEVRGTPLPSGGFVTTYTDITERKCWENELQAAKLAAEEANRAKSAVLNMVSHDLRTPLTSIRSFSEILHDNLDLGLGERRRFLAIIDKECQRLIRMINDLLDFAKIEAGRMEWCIAELDAGSLTEAAVASVAPMFEEKRVDLSLAIPLNVPPIMGDEDRLTQVLVNLLSNAFKFAPERAGCVKVGLHCGPSEVTVSVADNGPGIPVEQHEEIFREFRQALTQDGNHPSGTGLGLAICRRIVNHLGGRIWVESVVGQGATFSFTLPVGKVLSPAEK